MNFFGRQPTPPAVPRAPVAPAAPRPVSGNGNAGRPGSHRSMGSVGRVSTSSQSTPEPDEVAEDFAICSGEDAALDCGWGEAEVKESKPAAAALAAAENRVRLLEKQLQTERRLRKDAEDSLMQARSRMSTPADAWEACTDEDGLMDVGVQTDKCPQPERQAVEQAIEAAVMQLRARNDALEIENQMLQSELQRKAEEIAILKSDNKVLWAEQDAVRAAKDDFKDLQQQLAGHIKAGNLITKRPSSNANRVYAASLDGASEEADPFVRLRTDTDGNSPPKSPERSSEAIASRARCHSPESALANFMGIFHGDVKGESDQGDGEELEELAPMDPIRCAAAARSEPVSCDPFTYCRQGCLLCGPVFSCLLGGRGAGGRATQVWAANGGSGSFDAPLPPIRRHRRQTANYCSDGNRR